MTSPTTLEQWAPAVDEARRTYRVEYRRDLTGGGLDWGLWITGRGHWCEGSNGMGGPGSGGSFGSETEAHTAGRLWVETGGKR